MKPGRAADIALAGIYVVAVVVILLDLLVWRP